MNDMSQVIIPRSDQINADDLLAGPRTIRITGVNIKPGTEQPVAISIDGDSKVWRPCKSMSRCLVAAWGPDAKAYVGRSVTLYNDPKVKWGGMEVGGIRISHMTDINREMVIALTETKGKRKPHLIKPLVQISAPKPETDKWAGWVSKLQLSLGQCTNTQEVEAIAAKDSVQKALSTAPDVVKAQINAMIKNALDRLSEASADPLDVDDFPGVVTPPEAA